MIGTVLATTGLVSNDTDDQLSTSEIIDYHGDSSDLATICQTNIELKGLSNQHSGLDKPAPPKVTPTWDLSEE